MSNEQNRTQKGNSTNARAPQQKIGSGGVKGVSPGVQRGRSASGLEPGNSLPALRKASRPMLYSLFLLAGFLLGVIATLIFALLISGDQEPATIPSPQQGNVTIQADSTTLGLLFEQSASSEGQSFTNVQVQPGNGSQMTVSGDYKSGVLFIQTTRHITMTLQVLVTDCVLQLHILNVGVSFIPITGIVALFETRINQQIKQTFDNLTSNLSGKITYCIVGVKTEPTGLSIDVRVKVMKSASNAVLFPAIARNRVTRGTVY